MWCVAQIDGEYIERMEDVLRVYARPYKWDQPVIGFDERPVQLLAHAMPGRAMKSGSPARSDYEYVRCGTANVFCIVEALTGWRLTHATKNRKGVAYARALKKIARRYRHAKTIHLVQDNLSTHSEKSLIEAFGQDEGRALWRRFTVHFTPKHGSWLNVAEMEAGLVARECLGKRRIATLAELRHQVTAWRHRSERTQRQIRWKFRVRDARRVFRYEGIKTIRSEH
jgi:hypothetical protein